MKHDEAYLLRINLQSQVVAAHIESVKARIEGMKILNTTRESLGYVAAYDESSFMAEADELEQLANRLEGLSKAL